MKQKNSQKWDSSKDKEFYLTTMGEDGKFEVYRSNKYSLTEVEILSLIKVLLVNGRSKHIGSKILLVYEDSTPLRNDLTRERLSLIGIKNNEKENIKRKIITR